MRRRISETLAAPRLMFRATGAGTSVLAVAVVAAGLLPILGIVAVGRLVGAAAELSGSDDLLRQVGPAFALLCAAWIGEQFVQPVTTLTSGYVTRRVSANVAERVLESSLRPVGMQHLQDDQVIDRMTRSIGGAGNHPPESAVGTLAALVTTRITGLAAAVLLATVLWWAPLVLAVVWMVCGRWVARQFQLLVSGFELKTGELRRANYLRNLGLDAPAAKEVMVFGMGRWIGARFTTHWMTGMEALFRHVPGARREAGGRAALLAGSYLLVMLALANGVADGRTDLSGFLIAVQASLSLSALGWSGESQWIFASASASAREAQRLDSPFPVVEVVPPSPAAGPPAIRFEGVSFRYAGRAADAVTDLTLDVPGGTSLALVGANGAGKSTIVRLLAGLYSSHAGRISVDGAPLDPLGVRQRLAVVLQDFVRFDVLTARENIGLGRFDVPWTDADLLAVATAAGAADVITSLPASWDTVLSRQFPDGAELSGGQWQRIALARALFAVRHGADILVLDEPTAHLDARAEAQLYDRFLTLTRDVTTILVSHRFNTVRLADRIGVVESGRLVELGSHDELLALGGEYARMFALQAGRFSDD